MSAEGAKTFSWPWLSLLWGWDSLTMAFTGQFAWTYLTISSCYDSIPLTLVLIGKDGGLSTQCHSCRFDYQQRVLKPFPGPGYLCSEDGAVWLWHIYYYYDINIRFTTTERYLFPLSVFVSLSLINVKTLFLWVEIEMRFKVLNNESILNIVLWKYISDGSYD